MLIFWPAAPMKMPSANNVARGAFTFACKPVNAALLAGFELSCRGRATSGGGVGRLRDGLLSAGRGAGAGVFLLVAGAREARALLLMLLLLLLFFLSPSKKGSAAGSRRYLLSSLAAEFAAMICLNTDSALLLLPSIN